VKPGPKKAAAVGLVALAAGYWTWTAGTSVGRPSILLITIDTLRADHVGAYGAKNARTPNLDALAERGLLFEHAFTAVPLTLPSHSTILSGLLPVHHGVHLNDETFPASTPTLATILHDRGYATGAFVGAYVLDQRFGLARGFDVYDDQVSRGADPAREKRPAREVAERAARWIAAQTGPFVAWVHFFDPHFPYEPPAGFEAMDPYDGEISYVDACLGPLLKAAARGERGLLVLVVGDHGEDLGDHGERTHGFFLYDSTLRVPMILGGPDVPAGERRASLARTVDVLPTLLARLNVSAPPGVDGVDLLRTTPNESYAETLYPHSFGWAPLLAVRADALKYIDAPRAELYDVARDPSETRNALEQHSAEAARLRERVRAIAAMPARASNEHAQDPEVVERLQALGYVGGAPPAAEGPTRDPKDALDDYRLYQDGYTAEATGDRQEALRDFQLLVARQPESVLFGRSLASALNGAGRSQEALLLLDEVTRRAPDDLMSWYEKSKAEESQGRLEDALRSALRAAALGPRSPDALNQLGVCQAKTHRVREALQSFERALAIDPSNGPIWVNRGNAHGLLGETVAARDAFARAAALMRRQNTIKVNNISSK
jgi:choline-sulfatase